MFESKGLLVIYPSRGTKRNLNVNHKKMVHLSNKKDPRQSPVDRTTVPVIILPQPREKNAEMIFFVGQRNHSDGMLE